LDVVFQLLNLKTILSSARVEEDGDLRVSAVSIMGMLMRSLL